MTPLGKLTRRIESTLGRLLGTQPGDAFEPLDLLTSILRDVEQQVEPSGGGRRRVPFTQVGVVILAPRKPDQDRYAAALDDLDAKIRERLRELACDPPARLDVAVQFARKPRRHWAADQRVELLFSRDASGAAAARAAAGARVPGAKGPVAKGPASKRSAAKGPASRASAAKSAVPAVKLVILRGTAGRTTYALEQAVIRVGRGDDLADAAGRTRRNDVAFQEAGDDVNRTVARAQAHLRFDAARGEFRLFDDGSSNGTRVVREAEVFTVTPHGPRGVRVASGDILEFGRARVRFEIKS